MTRDRMLIRVPGSTSNLGAGFDSLGLAIERYLQLDVIESKEWVFELHSSHLGGLPTNEDNLIYQVASDMARSVGRDLPACRVKMTSELPIARGLGSSAAAIVAGIELADQWLHLDWSLNKKFQKAFAYENHGDNIAASLFGGFVVTAPDQGKARCFPAGVPDVEMVMIVPSYELETSKAREVLPEAMSFQDAVRASSIANMTIAAILKNDWALAGEMMMEDLFHQPYRKLLVPEMEKFIKIACDTGAFGAALSGAGPSVIAFVPVGRGMAVVEKLNRCSPSCEVFSVLPACHGVSTQFNTPSTLS